MYALIRRQAFQAYSYINLPLWRAFFPAIWRAILQLVYLQKRELNNTTDSLSQCIHFIPRTYDDVQLERSVEPHKREIRFVYHSPYGQWHVKVTFRGKLQIAPNPYAECQKRRTDLMNLCLNMNLDGIALLHDTVTELLIMCEQDTTVAQTWQPLLLKKQSAIDADSEYTRPLWLHIREDSWRVRYPLCTESGIPTHDLSEISKIQELSMGVHRVKVGDSTTDYVYKEVNRPMYVPRDSEVLEQELRTLQLGIDGVVQLIAPVVSSNPYQTKKTTYNATVLQGLLLEYHPNGTLQDALKSTRECLLWRQWAIQITGTLHRLHQENITHMDLKPANIVLSKGLDAILIDVSGIGGTTRDWLSPQMIVLINPLEQEFELRKQNDIWALGKILSAMADATHDKDEQQMLKNISLKATTECLPRLSLPDVLSELKAFHSSLDQLTS